MDCNWLDRTEYPFESRFFDVNGHRLHYIDEGKGPVLLFVHGTPSWSFDFRNVIKQLSSDYRCIAVDHIGFGLSDKPRDYDYSTINHSRTLERFIKEMNLREVNLIVHDFGGPIGFHYAINHPENVDKIVVINSWLWSTRGDADFQRMRKLIESPLMPFLYRYLNMSVRFLLPRSFGDNKMPRATWRQYAGPYRRMRDRTGLISFASSLVKDQDWFESVWNMRQNLKEKDVLFVWGMKDSFVKPEMLEKFHSGFPHAKVVRFPTAGHFPQEEDPEGVATAIMAFLSNRNELSKVERPAS